MTFPKGNIWYKFVFKEQTSSNSFVLAEYSDGYVQTILFCLF